jgi:hypothetical protein
MSNNTVLKGLIANIFRGKHKFSGLLSHVDEVTVLDCPDGAIFEATPERPAVKLNVRIINGNRVIAAIPLLTDEQAEQVKGMCGPSFGGSYIASSDSRFSAATGFYGAIALQDLWWKPL